MLFKSKQIIKSILKRAGFLNVFPHSSNITVANDFRIGLYPSITISPTATIKIDRNVEMRRYCNIIVENGAQLIIGENVFFNNYCSINCHDRIHIDANTIIGEGVKFYDHNHKYVVESTLEIFKDQFTTSQINIGKNCWIGSNVVILKGVTIGDNSIIGANCLLHKSLPANSIVKSKCELIVNDLTKGNG